MSVKLEKFIDFVNRTGEPCFIADPHSNEIVVMMTLDRYEELQFGCGCDGDCGCEEGMTEEEFRRAMEHQELEEMRLHPPAYAGDVPLSDEPEIPIEKDDDDRFYLEPLE